MSTPQNDEQPRDDAPLEENDEESPDAEEIEEPSTETNPDQEPKAAEPHDPEPSHEAVGIGVVGRPQVEPEAEG